MQVARKGNTIVLRLDHGEDILDSILKSVGDADSTMILTAGLGMISDFELGYFDNGQYITKAFSEACELLSMQGSVAAEGDPKLHIHVAVADRSHAAFGGHLLRGKVWMSNEIFLMNVEGLGSIRQFDPAKKVGVLQLRT
ncbi:MAG: DUF296 domain-containing protein [Methanobacteriota archaeon]|nr:MAG: DUF296 domain-containing protein [Euryarchaeota archaeon]